MKNFRTNEKGMVGIFLAIIIVVIIIIASVALYWTSTHYAIAVGEIGVVTDQWGGFIRAEVGPKGYAEKGFFETVKLYTAKIQLEEMVSDVKKVSMDDGTGRMVLVDSVDPAPYPGSVYPALFATTSDASAYIDLELMWHIDTTSPDWKDKLRVLYTNFPDEAVAKETAINTVRDYARKYAQEFTTYELVYGNGIAYSNGVTQFCQEKLDEIDVLGKAVVLDKIFARRTTAPEAVQIQYNRVLAAQKAAETIMIEANATRDSAIAKAQGQSTSISLVINATTRAMEQLFESGWTQEQIVQYLTTQYQFDSLKAIYQSNPQANITLFIDTPDATYTIPLKPTS